MRRLFLALLSACSLLAACRLELTAHLHTSAIPPMAAPQPPELPASPFDEVAGVPPAARLYARPVIRAARFYWGFHAPIATFLAQMHQESGFRADADSGDAEGLAQFTPATAASIARMYPADLGDARPLDPAWAIRALVIYDRDLTIYFIDGDSADDQLGFALAAYNGGARWIDRERGACLAKAPACDSSRYFGNVQNECGASIPARSAAACEENRHYPEVILHRWRPLYEKWLEANAIQ
jgi:soluble lytic murein transglycosylase-like protein